MTTTLGLWIIGLSSEECEILQRSAGESYLCRSLDSMDSAKLAELLDSFVSTEEDKDEPLLLWLGSGAWQRLGRQAPELMRRLVYLPVVLLLAENSERTLLEEALNMGFQQILQAPLLERHVHEALSRALEVRNLYQDMSRMSREIIMTRELLDRKSQVCALMLRVFSAISEAADAPEMLRRCADELHDLLDLRGLHVLWWGNGKEALAFVGQDDAHNRLDAASSHVWCECLRAEAPEQVRKLPLRLICCGGCTASPDAGKMLWLPLELRGRQQGVLALMFERPLLVGRDMSLALDAVRHFLALSLDAHVRYAGESDSSVRLQA